MSSRRDFLKISALASASALMPSFLRGLNARPLDADGRKLVVIQLSGGNDGLNTFIPFRDDLYYRSRPGLGIAKGDIIQFNEYQGINPALEPLARLYDEGQFTLFNSVGYPNPDRSHFRSMDIWHTGSSGNEYWNSGWLGRYLDHSCEGCAKPQQIVEIDDTLSLAVKGEYSNGLAVRDPKRLYEATRDPWLNSLSQHPSAGNEEVSYLYKTLTETLHSAEYIYEKSNIFASKIVYPAGNKLAAQLKMVAELITSGVETSVFYVSLSGFDTHVRQRGMHDRLLGQYASAVRAFTDDLKQNNRFDETLIMTFSEFGRRVEENAGGGTDHGKASNLFLLGGKLAQPGIYNPPPDLSKLDEGDVTWKIDFRRVYASVLKDWLGADDAAILMQKFDRIKVA